MTRYFFHIRDRENLIADEEGIDLGDLELARAEATRSVASLRNEAALEGENIDHQTIEVVDAEGMIYHTVSVGGMRDSGTVDVLGNTRSR